MRDFIKIVDLYESRGLGARRSGEEFVSTTNPEDKIYVDSIEFYPKDRPQYSSLEELGAELKQIAYATNAYVDLIAEFSAKDLAFGIAIFKRPDETKLAFVKPFRFVRSDPTQNMWDNQRGIPGYRYNSKSAAKTQAGLTPQDILTRQSNLSSEDVVSQIVEKFGEDSPLTTAARAVASGTKFPITIDAPQGVSFTAFRDYFCELLHPIALQTGNYKDRTGKRIREAAQKFLNQDGFGGTTINFGTDKTEGLSDSILISDSGSKIKISSKGAVGAQASAKNLLDAVNEMRIANPKLAKKHADIIDVITEMTQAGQAGAPLLLGVKYGIIDDRDADVIRNLKNQSRVTLASVESMKLSKKLKKLILERKTDDPQNVNLYFHALAAVAHKVAEHVNEKTNFSEAASEILNNAALIQIWTVATEAKDKWTIQEFNAKWPGDETKGVKFSASKTYYSTGIKGNFTFKILKGGDTDVADVDTQDQAPVQSKPEIAAPSVVTGKRVDIRPTTIDVPVKQNIGRERR